MVKFTYLEVIVTNENMINEEIKRAGFYQYLQPSLRLREEHRLKLFKNRVLRRIGPKGNKVIEGWRELHNEELHNLYTS
jgi:hypothetical protein